MARSLWPVLVVGAIFLSALSKAEDVSYTLHVNIIEPALILDPDVKITVAASGQRKRFDLSLQAGPVHKHMTALYLYDKQQVYYLDSEHHNYMISPLTPGQDEIMDLLGKLQQRMAAGEGTADNPRVSPTLTFQVEDKGEVTLGKQRAHLYLETVSAESEDGKKAPSRTITREIWLSSTPLGSATANTTVTTSSAHTTTEDKQGGYKTRGDLEQARKLNAYVPLKMKISVTDGPVVEVDTRNISQKPLEATQFTIPSGFQEISPEAFAKQMQNGRKRAGRDHPF